MRIATTAGLWVFASVLRRTELSNNVLIQDAGGYRRTPKMTPGVKWSQVQILLADLHLPL
jgi:hypothetical protein